MERFYRFADITFRITGNDCDMYREDGVLAPFRVTEQMPDHSIHYEIVENLPKPEGECTFKGERIMVFRNGDTQLSCMGDTALLPEGAHTQIRRQGKETRVQVLRKEVPDRIKPRLVLNTLEAEHHIVQHGGLLLHSSFIRVEDKAILFTAPSGTGKSTQAELWRLYENAHIINGDRGLLRFAATGWRVYGSPYAGSSGIYTNLSAPVACIVVLSQGPENRLKQLSPMAAFQHLYRGTTVPTWDTEAVEVGTVLLLKLLETVPVYHLSCRPDRDAVEVLKQVL
jgi:hypothetical protein